MIHILRWGEHLPDGNMFSELLTKDILYFREVIDRLRASGYTYISKNSEGIVYEDTKDFTHPFEPDILLKEDKPTEVTGEFFLFYDHLPKHIKKEIKIYINKTEE